jgi:prevent-host-death family protein
MSSSTIKTKKNDSIVVSALRARTHFGSLLQRVETERRSLVIEKRGTPRAVLLGIRDYVRLAAPEPEVLRLIGEESIAQGTDRIASLKIDAAIRAARRRKSRRR